jgi:hypothetical protein
VDGGYFENSGAATAVELLQAMRSVARKIRPRQVALNLILIRNDPEESSLCKADAPASARFEPYTYLNDLLSPLRALLSTRVARGRLAEENALNFLRSRHRDTDSVQSPGCRDGCVFEFSLGGGDIEPPLGWSLSDRAKDQMNAHLGKQDHKFACIRGLLTGAGCDAAPTCAARR